jgi:hypothetical protein
MATQPNSYKQVVELFQSISESQLAVKQFQIGMPSDMDIESDVDPFQRFPLVFMVPQVSSMDRFGKMILGFTLTVADIAKDNIEDLQINTYNNTLMIMQDIFSKIIMTDWNTVGIKIETPINIIPFQEAANNNLTGWTAEINVEVKSPFNLCDAAFN